MAEQQRAEELFKAHCPRCDGERVCVVHGRTYVPWSWDDGRHSQNGGHEYRLLQCRGCEIVFYWCSAWDSESLDYEYDEKGETVTIPNYTIETFPTPEIASKRPDWSWNLHQTDKTLGAIMNEVYQASEAGSHILASVGLRTAFDRTAEILGIDRELPMSDKVKALHDGGWVGATEAQTLGVVAEAGNAAAHRGWSPDKAEFDLLLDTLEQFIKRSVLSGNKALAIGPKIPKRPRKTRSP